LPHCEQSDLSYPTPEFSDTFYEEQTYIVNNNNNNISIFSQDALQPFGWSSRGPVVTYKVNHTNNKQLCSINSLAQVDALLYCSSSLDGGGCREKVPKNHFCWDRPSSIPQPSFKITGFTKYATDTPPWLEKPGPVCICTYQIQGVDRKQKTIKLLQLPTQ
jgi:hypothetical protein